jgi:nicotinamidase-related amidase
MQFQTNETAIVLVEFQKQWTEKGLFNQLIKHQLDSRNVIRNTQHLIAKIREKGIVIIHAPLVVDPYNKKGWLAHLTFGQIFTKDTWKAEITPGLFDESDPIAQREYYNLKAFDAFFESGLELVLKDHAIKNLFICGFATDQCPAKTLRTALRKGFNAYLVSDCTATFNGSFQRMAERKHSDRVVASHELLAKLN